MKIIALLVHEKSVICLLNGSPSDRGRHIWILRAKKLKGLCSAKTNPNKCHEDSIETSTNCIFRASSAKSIRQLSRVLWLGKSTVVCLQHCFPDDSPTIRQQDDGRAVGPRCKMLT